MQHYNLVYWSVLHFIVPEMILEKKSYLGETYYQCPKSFFWQVRLKKRTMLPEDSVTRLCCDCCYLAYNPLSWFNLQKFAPCQSLRSRLGWYESIQWKRHAAYFWVTSLNAIAAPRTRQMFVFLIDFTFFTSKFFEVRAVQWEYVLHKYP